MEEILHQLVCKYPVIYRVSYMLGGAEFNFFHQQYHWKDLPHLPFEFANILQIGWNRETRTSDLSTASPVVFPLPGCAMVHLLIGLGTRWKKIFGWKVKH